MSHHHCPLSMYPLSLPVALYGPVLLCKLLHSDSSLGTYGTVGQWLDIFDGFYQDHTVHTYPSTRCSHQAFLALDTLWVACLKTDDFEEPVGETFLD